MSGSGNAQEDVIGGIAQSAALYPQKLDLAQRRALLMRMTQADYRAASFLDDRLLTPQTQGAWLPLDVLQTQAARIDPRPLHFIFHIGHVGSTLISRLLDEAGGVLSLREPLPLRQLADLFDHRADTALLETMLQQWSRGFADTQAVILKATSAAGRIAPQLLTALPTARALYLTLGAEAHIAGMLAGENSAAEMNAMGPERLSRLRRLLDEPALPQPRSLAELAAMGWLAERMTQCAVMTQFPQRVLEIDFGQFLQHTEEILLSILRHFALPDSSEQVAALMNSPLWQRYSKAPNQNYSTALRAQVLNEARKAYAPEIARAMTWLEDLAKRHADVAQVFDT